MRLIRSMSAWMIARQKKSRSRSFCARSIVSDCVHCTDTTHQGMAIPRHSLQWSKIGEMWAMVSHNPTSRGGKRTKWLFDLLTGSNEAEVYERGNANAGYCVPCK